MSKFQTGDRVQLDDEYNPDSATGVVTAVTPISVYYGVKTPLSKSTNPEGNVIEDGYSIKWDDGWVDDPEVYYYDSELKKAEEK